MPTLPTEVQPGDIISSELMTAILDTLSQLSDAVLTGTQNVPNVIGMTLINARTLILQPSRQLAMGFVVDINGAVINPNAAANANLIVLNQSPVGGALAPINSSVNLVVSQSSTSSPNPNPGTQPVIAGTETLEGDSVSEFSVGENVVLVGNNFSVIASQNLVTFNGVSALVNGDPVDPTRRLIIEVPRGIPGAPTDPGDATLENVDLIVRHALTNLSATTQIDITAPVPNAPTIDSLSHSIRNEGQNLIITGSNYSSESVVMVREVEVDIVEFTESTIEVTIPDFPDITGNSLVSAPVVVTNPDAPPAIFLDFRVLGVTNTN